MQELTIPLDAGEKQPLYLQIYTFIRREAEAGRIVKGEKLPSARALALQLNVSRSTVDLAYGQLVAEGYLEAYPCRGYFLSGLEAVERQDLPEETCREIPAGQREEEGIRWDFTLSGIAPDGFPCNVWRKLSREVLASDDGSLFQLGDPQGDRGLREAIASYLYHSRGALCAPEQILVGAGNDYLLLLLSVILGEERRVAMEDPTYRSARETFGNLGWPVCAVAMDSQGMDPEELRKSGADLAYVMPSHQFPMGTVMPIGRRMKLLAWAAEKEGRYLIEDDYDSEFRYRGKPIPALLGADTLGKVIYLGTFSRSVAPAIRVSYMVLPSALMKRYRGLNKVFSATVSRVDQKILELFLKQGYYSRHLNRMRIRYREKRDLLAAGLRRIAAVESIVGEEAGVHLAVRLKKGVSEQRRVRQAASLGVRVYGLSGYLLGERREEDPPVILLGYAAMEAKELKEALKRLEKAWGDGR